MGKLIQGEWATDDKLKAAEVAEYQRAGGKFERGSAGFRNWVTADGSAGPSGLAGFKAAPARTDQGWVFRSGDARFGDELYSLSVVHELYTRADADYSGRATVPILWDKQKQAIVSNESSEII